jgi:TonB family protein
VVAVRLFSARMVMGAARKVGTTFLLYSLLLVIVPAISPIAHAENRDKNPRKLVMKVPPEYPMDLKRAKIGGTVRLDIVVSPGGGVETISVAGGNPILAEYASRAVKKWKYIPADMKSNLRISVEFDPFH